MKVTNITARLVSVPLHEPFVISLGTITAADSVFVTVETDTGLVGHGEGAGLDRVTGETPSMVLDAVTTLEPAVLGCDPFAIHEVHRAMDAILVHNGAAKAALDIALYDIMAQAAGVPLYRFLGGVASSVETDMTIGLGTPEVMAARAGKLVATGYRQIKIKAGSDDDQDRAAIAAIRAAAPHAHLKVDANQGWTAPQALRMLDCYREYGVDAVEQPVPCWDLDGLAWVRDHSPIPVMADESCFTPQDASAIVRRGAADMINIKLMKCGGIYPALAINTIAEAAGIRCMVGCMLESSLGIAAAAHLVAARPNIVYADLDSFSDFDDSGVIGSAFELDAPYIRLTDQPGLGVKVLV